MIGSSVGCEGLLSCTISDAVGVLEISGISGSVPHSEVAIRGGMELVEKGLEGIEGRGVSDGWVLGKARG